MPDTSDVPEPTVGSVIGINEAVSIPNKVIGSLDAAERATEWATDISAVRGMGVEHVRIHTAHYPFLSWHGQRAGDTGAADEVIVEILEAGLQPLVMIGPWPGNETANHTDRYLPDDLPAYAAWVTETVERYDGDGVDDAPGLIGKVRVWEIDNEPDLHHFVAPRQEGSRPVFRSPGGFEPPEEYAEVAVWTARAIHAADPSAVVLLAGMWEAQTPRGQEYLRTVLSDPDVLTSVDAINVHRYPKSGVEAVWDAMGRAGAAAPGKPVWITEVSTPSKGQSTERSQAEDLINLVLGALRRGVPRVYWHALIEGPTYYQRDTMATVGRHLLVGAPGTAQRWHGIERWPEPHRKLAAWSLREFLVRFGGTPRHDVRTVQASPGAEALHIGNEVLVYWAGKRPENAAVKLPFSGPVSVHALVPAQDRGIDVVGSPTWPTWRAQTDDVGNLTVNLSRGPVRVAPDGR